MTLSEFIKNNGLLQSFPPIDFFEVLTNGKDIICWVDIDCFRKNSYFLKVNEAGEIIGELSFKEIYQKIDTLFENGWYKSENSFVDIDIKLWIENFADGYGIPLT